MTARLSHWATIPLVFTLFAILTIAPARAGGDVGPVAAPAPVANKFVGWWELGGYYGTDESSRGEIVLFTPLAQSATTIFFLDARGKFFEEDVQEANLALGYRKMMPSGWNIGVWGGWDIRDTTNDNTFNQISFGFEALSERYDVRVNGYVPLEDSKGVSDTDTFEALLQGNNIFVQGTNTDIDELAFYGVDAEFGILLFGGNRVGGGYKGAAPAGRHELRAYAGGFYFDNDDADDAIAGPKGRLEYRINDVIGSLPGSRLTIESELSYDEVHDTKFEIGARLRIPFGAFGRGGPLQTAHLSAQELRMTEGLERDTDIVTNEETETTVTTEGAIDDATDVALDNVSFAKTADQFAKAVNDGGNRLIIVQKGNKRIDVSDTDGQQLQDDQTVQGGASTILIRGKKSGAVVPFTAPGKRPTIFTNDMNFDTGAITVANNTHVAGLNIRGSGGRNTSIGGNNGVGSALNVDNVVLEQLDIRQMGGEGINIGGDSRNIVLAQNTLSDLGSTGVLFRSGSANVTVMDTVIENVGLDGLRFLSNGRNLEVVNVKVDDVANDGIGFNTNQTNVLINGADISNAGDRGINFISDNRNIWIENARIRNVGGNGIGFTNDNSDINIGYSQLKDIGNNGINFSSDNSNVTIYETTIRKTGNRGINFSSGNSNVTLMHLDIADTNQGAIEFISSNEDISIAHAEISNAGFNGVSFGSSNKNVTIEDTRIRNAGFRGLSMNSNNQNVLLRNVQILDPDNHGVRMSSNNDNVTFDTLLITSAGNNGIEMSDDNTNIKLINSTIDGPDNNGINMNSGNRVKITDSTISNTGLDAINATAFNTLDINGTTFAGNVGGNILDINGGMTFINGANNPNNATVGGFVCNGAGNFLGTITIGNQTFVDSAGCN